MCHTCNSNPITIGNPILTLKLVKISNTTDHYIAGQYGIIAKTQILWAFDGPPKIDPLFNKSAKQIDKAPDDVWQQYVDFAAWAKEQSFNFDKLPELIKTGVINRIKSAGYNPECGLSHIQWLYHKCGLVYNIRKRRYAEQCRINVAKREATKKEKSTVTN